MQNLEVWQVKNCLFPCFWSSYNCFHIFDSVLFFLFFIFLLGRCGCVPRSKAGGCPAALSFRRSCENSLSTGTPNCTTAHFQLAPPNCTTAHLTPPSQRPTQTNWQTRKLTLWELVSNQQVNWNQQRIVSNLLQFWNSLSSLPLANCTLKNEPWCCPNKL